MSMNILSCCDDLLHFIKEFIVLTLTKAPQKEKEYVKLKLYHLFLIKTLRLRTSRQRIFDYKVKFINFNDFIRLFREIFVNENYYFQTEKKSPFIIDCGANIGMAVFYFKKLFPESKILGFEPDERNFKILKNNIEINNLKDIELFNKAIYDSEGRVDLYYDLDCRDSVTMSTRKERFSNKDSKKVDSVPLSRYIERDVDFLKMDIEGAEDLVLKELSRENKLKLIKQIVIEYHHHIKPKDDNLSEAFKILEENGFGYQISASLRENFKREKFQDLLIFAYQK